MIKSMTGYGRAQRTENGWSVTAEIRSVNHRYFDWSIRIPRVYVFMEEPLKAQVQKSVSRGKVDVFITIENETESNVVVELNREVADAYVSAIKELGSIYGIEENIDIMSLARFPEVFNVTKAEEDMEAIFEIVSGTLAEATENYMSMCLAEGENLKADILLRAETIESAVERIEKRSITTVEEYREKLMSRMRDILQDSGIDEARILTEAAIYADKIAVNEETVRLRSHIEQLRTMLETGGAIGRKLDFLIQEFNREANTIGSKGNDLSIAREVVDVKAEIEKIREQVQNIE